MIFMLRTPPTIGQRTPRPKAADPNGTRSLLGSRRYRNWREQIALQRLNRCEVCWNRDGRVINYRHLHHIKPRSLFPELVMDAANVQLLCVDHHDETHSTGVDKTKPLNCTAICGPPCSGKSTYVKTWATSTDIVWDWDIARQEIGLTRNDEITPANWQRMLDMRKSTISKAQDSFAKMWLIATYPQSQLVCEAATHVVVLKTDRTECLARLEQRTIDLSLTEIEQQRTSDSIDGWFGVTGI